MTVWPRTLLSAKRKSLDSKPRLLVWCRGFAPARRVTRNLLRFDSLGLDHYKLPHRSLVEELDAPRDLGKESVVFAASNIQSRLDPRAALTHDDRAAGYQLSAKSLEAKPLRVRVAPVS